VDTSTIAGADSAFFEFKEQQVNQILFQGSFPANYGTVIFDPGYVYYNAITTLRIWSKSVQIINGRKIALIRETIERRELVWSK
jgi:hypothetical protein